MVKSVINALDRIRARDSRKVDSVLLTGHSAGGAVAQILYAMSHSPDSALGKAFEGISLSWGYDLILMH
jgi:hypothetical protein